jgi:hypothetical protein
LSASGVRAYIEYGKQSNFTTPLSVGASTRRLGLDEEVTNLSINNTKLELGDLNNSVVTKFAFGEFLGTLGVDFALSNGWFFDAFLNNGVQGGTAGDRTYTYDPDSSVVNAYTFEAGLDTTTDRVVQLQRATLKDIEFSAAVGEVVRCSTNWEFGDTPTTAGTTLDASVASDAENIAYTFASGAILEHPSATPLVQVQDMRLRVDSGITHVREPNSFKSVSAYKGKLGISGTFSLSVLNNTWWNNVMARAEPGSNTIRFNFTNGLTAGNEKSIQITLTGLGLGELNMPISKYKLVEEEIPFTARTMQVIINTPTNAIP